MYQYLKYYCNSHKKKLKNYYIHSIISVAISKQLRLKYDSVSFQL